MPAKKKDPTYDDVAAQHDAMQDALSKHELPALDEALAKAQDIKARRQAALDVLTGINEEALALGREVQALPQRSEAARKRAGEVISTLMPAGRTPGGFAGDRLAAARAAARPAG